MKKKTSGARELVYSLLKSVPKGRVTTYNELAVAAGIHPRAVGVFMKTNDETGTIPCFRVVMSDGSIGAYSKGTEMKIELLRADGIKVENKKINLRRYNHKF